MGFLGAGSFMDIISSYRLLWIGGRFGGHKTSLAYKLAERYLDRGYRLVSNNRSVWGEDLNKLPDLNEDGQLRCVIILDEGGTVFKSSRQIELIAAYARKMDTIFIIPSFFPPTRAAQVMVCQPVFNFKATGLPLIVYKWRVKLGSFTDQGWFCWWDPSDIYGIYSTADPGDTAEKIIEWLIEKTEQYRRGFGYSNSLSTVEETEGDEFTDAIHEFSQAIDELSSIPIRKGKRRRG